MILPTSSKYKILIGETFTITEKQDLIIRDTKNTIIKKYNVYIVREF